MSLSTSSNKTADRNTTSSYLGDYTSESSTDYFKNIPKKYRKESTAKKYIKLYKKSKKQKLNCDRTSLFKKNLTEEEKKKCKADADTIALSNVKLALKKLYTYYKDILLINEISKVKSNTDEVILKNIAMYTNILKNIFNICKTIGTNQQKLQNGRPLFMRNQDSRISKDNPYISDIIANKMTYTADSKTYQQSRGTYNEFFELNAAYINYIYKIRTNSKNVLSRLNQITDFSKKFQDVIKNDKAYTNDICPS